MFLLRDKMIMQGEKREKSTQTCNETMLARQVEDFCVSYLAAFNVQGLGYVIFMNAK